jgi:septum formation protein
MERSVSGDQREHEPRLVLASLSPRRRELLRYLGVVFTSVANDAEESEMEPPPAIAAAFPAFPLHHRQHPTLLAWRKAQAAIEDGWHDIILAADTIVTVDNQVLGKPRHSADAHRMLRQLAGRTHTVYTGVALLGTRHPHEQAFDIVCSYVHMRALSDQEIAAYVATGEPFDKAGAYGIQGLGGRLVERVDGSYTNVVGLPLGSVHRLLQQSGPRPAVTPADAFQQWLADNQKDMPPCTAP